MDVAESAAEWKEGETFVIVGRHAENITLNDYEFLLDEKNCERKFPSEEKAKSFLRSHNVTDDEIDWMTFFYCTKCPSCGAEVVQKTDNVEITHAGKVMICGQCRNVISITTQ